MFQVQIEPRIQGLSGLPGSIVARPIMKIVVNEFPQAVQELDNMYKKWMASHP